MPSDRSPQALTRRREFKACAVPNGPGEAVMSVGLPPESLKKKLLVCKSNKPPSKKGTPPSKSEVGFVLMDSSQNPTSFNTEALRILAYPDECADPKSLDVLLTRKIHSSLISRQHSGELPFVAEFRSGRRRYFCRAFLVDSQAKDASQPSVAVLLERGPSGSVALSQASQQFNLTQREREALEYLLQGLNGKEIANRMNISPNTVKAFLRLIMIKTGVTSRSAMVAKIIMTQP